MSVFLWIAALVVTLIIAGIVYQWLGSRRDREIHTSQGRCVSIGNGSSLYLYEAGFGEPTVLFEAGIGATHLNWRSVQDATALFTGTVSYDRGGLGWSSRCRTPRTPGNIAVELHQMLDCAGLKSPYILVGHSFGGLVMRRFALLYPQEVVGIVLVDPMRCEEWPPLDPSKQSQIELGRRLIRCTLPAVHCGLVRLVVSLALRHAGGISNQVAGATGSNGRHVVSRIKTEVGKMPREVWPAVAAHWSRPGFYAGIRSHIKSIPLTVAEMHSAEPIRSIPVTVLTPGNATPLSEDHLRRIGDSVRQIVAAGSEHWIHLDEPELVVDSIRAMLDASVPQAVAAAN
ncbi:MAG: alpha/beta hydrolase [Terracidiphilus sp.]|jgi:pimeloyl-ACP methyl ester carboxylesterase